MTQPRVRRPLVPGLAVVAMMAVLTGCSDGAVTTTGTAPGTAAEVGDVTITQSKVDRTARAICDDLEPQLAEEGPVALIQVKQYALNLLTARAQAALQEADTARRLAMYEAMQRDSMERAPFVFMLQTVNTAACRKDVTGVRLGTLADANSYDFVRKG